MKNVTAMTRVNAETLGSNTGLWGNHGVATLKEAKHRVRAYLGDLPFKLSH